MTCSHRDQRLRGSGQSADEAGLPLHGVKQIASSLISASTTVAKNCKRNYYNTEFFFFLGNETARYGVEETLIYVPSSRECCSHGGPLDLVCLLFSRRRCSVSPSYGAAIAVSSLPLLTGYANILLLHEAVMMPNESVGAEAARALYVESRGLYST